MSDEMLSLFLTAIFFALMAALVPILDFLRWVVRTREEFGRGVPGFFGVAKRSTPKGRSVRPFEGVRGDHVGRDSPNTRSKTPEGPADQTSVHPGTPFC